MRSKLGEIKRCKTHRQCKVNDLAETGEIEHVGKHVLGKQDDANGAAKSQSCKAQRSPMSTYSKWLKYKPSVREMRKYGPPP